MLTEAYIEALLVDEELADHVWKAWDRDEIGDFVANCIWLWIAYNDGKNAERNSHEDGRRK